jgi:hypothetical protein
VALQALLAAIQLLAPLLQRAAGAQAPRGTPGFKREATADRVVVAVLGQPEPHLVVTEIRLQFLQVKAITAEGTQDSLARHILLAEEEERVLLEVMRRDLIFLAMAGMVVHRQSAVRLSLTQAVAVAVFTALPAQQELAALVVAVMAAPPLMLAQMEPPTQAVAGAVAEGHLLMVAAQAVQAS